MERPSLTAKGILSRFRKFRNPRNIAGMARFGVCADDCFGVPIPALRARENRPT